MRLGLPLAQALLFRLFCDVVNAILQLLAPLQNCVTIITILFQITSITLKGLQAHPTHCPTTTNPLSAQFILKVQCLRKRWAPTRSSIKFVRSRSYELIIGVLGTGHFLPRKSNFLFVHQVLEYGLTLYQNNSGSGQRRVALSEDDRSREDEWCGPITCCRWQCCAFDSTASVHSIPVKRGDRILRKLGFYINIFGILLKRKTLTIFNLEFVWSNTTAKNIFTLKWGLRGQNNMENGRNYLGFLTTHISSVIRLIQACTAPLFTPCPWDPLGGWQSNLALHFGQRGSPLPLPPQWRGKELWNGVQKKRKLLFVKTYFLNLIKIIFSSCVLYFTDVWFCARNKHNFL